MGPAGSVVDFLLAGLHASLHVGQLCLHLCHVSVHAGTATFRGSATKEGNVANFIFVLNQVASIDVKCFFFIVMDRFSLIGLLLQGNFTELSSSL